MARLVANTNNRSHQLGLSGVELVGFVIHSFRRKGTSTRFHDPKIGLTAEVNKHQGGRAALRGERKRPSVKRHQCWEDWSIEMRKKFLFIFG